MRNNTDPNQISFFDPSQDRSVVERRKFYPIHAYNDIVSIENLLVSWQEFLRGKRKRKDVAKFTLNFSDSLISLHTDLINKTYEHAGYHAFKISDPKPRDIHKAGLRDRIVHHAIYRVLYPFFAKKFIFDSYSCIKGKGTHRAINRLREFGRKVSKNNTKTTWVLKCDIRKFFASIDHDILKRTLSEYVDAETHWLLCRIIDSFNTKDGEKIGIPLGNLTSQLFVNIYMNEFDQFVKRKLKARYYIRYADDFLILNEDKNHLEELVPKISQFLETELRLTLHPNKLFIKTLTSGIDFLGWITFPNYRIPRTSTKRRMFKKLGNNKSKETLNSYLGLLSHGDTYELTQKIGPESQSD